LENPLNLRRNLYFTLAALRGRKFGRYYQTFVEQDRLGIPADTLEKRLVSLLDHSIKNVPYYARLSQKLRGSYRDDPFEYLTQMPVLTKPLIRTNSQALLSVDIDRRAWFSNASGGSTGEPIEIIQDRAYTDQITALTLLYSRLAGRELGEPQIQLWGSLSELNMVSESLKSRFQSRLENNLWLNAFHMTSDRMRDYLSTINRIKPKLILAYVSAIFDLANFCEREKINIEPQNAIMTSAGMLYPHMREVIERVFKCPVYNRYGSREVGDIACERKGLQGLWVAPWGNYIEVVDEHGNRLPDGCEGEILVTSLTNYVMPLIRYRIGDRGYLCGQTKPQQFAGQQIFGDITGRTYESFRKLDGSIVNPAYFVTVMFHRSWVKQYQVIQKDYGLVIYRIVKATEIISDAELNEIIEKTRLVMGQDCEVQFDFVREIPESASGKLMYLVTEVRS
jgi:phenylacetate-CoA ligase